MRNKPILCVDFDGVIHSYVSPWQGADIISDPPVPGALRWLWKATEWFDVQVYSSRSKTNDGIEAMRRWMVQESVKEFGPDHEMAQNRHDGYAITFCHEKPAAFLTIDDRAITFEGDWSELDPADLLNFKPWNKRGASNVAMEKEQERRQINAQLESQRRALELSAGVDQAIRDELAQRPNSVMKE